VRFSYDINGLLEVDVTFLESGQKHSHSIDRSPTGLDADAPGQPGAPGQAQDPPARHPAQPNPAGSPRTRLDAGLGDERELISGWLDAFNSVLARQQAESGCERQALSQALDELRY
jgi:molecular chaperone HscC